MISTIWESIPTWVIACIILVVVLWALSRYIMRAGPPVEIISGDFSVPELNQYDGQAKPQTFLAVKGVIYDVSGSWFYRKGAPYGKLAGHDASINLAKMSHDAGLLDKWGSIALTAEE